MYRTFGCTMTQLYKQWTLNSMKFWGFNPVFVVVHYGHLVCVLCLSLSQQNSSFSPSERLLQPHHVTRQLAYLPVVFNSWLVNLLSKFIGVSCYFTCTSVLMWFDFPPETFRKVLYTPGRLPPWPLSMNCENGWSMSFTCSFFCVLLPR